jgi:hypothetical protein
MAVTSAVSAKPAGKSDVRQYDMKVLGANDEIYVYGKLTVKVLADGTGTYVVNVNGERLNGYYDYTGKEMKDVFRADMAYNPVSLMAFNSDANPAFIQFGELTLNNGGTGHGAGTLDADTVTWLDTWGDNPATMIAFG